MDHIIEVSFVGNLVHAEPNPLPARANAPQPEIRVGPGDTVTWVLVGTAQGRNLQVVFDKIADLTQDGGVGSLRDVNLHGSFIAPLDATSLKVTIGPDVSQDIKRSQRLFYKIFENGKPLEWDNRVKGAPDQLVGGGIDNPRTPP